MRLPWWPKESGAPETKVRLVSNWLQAGFLLGLGFWLAGVFIAVLTTLVLLAGGAAILGGVLKSTTSSPATPGVIDVTSLPTCAPNYRFYPNKPNDICRVP